MILGISFFIIFGFITLLLDLFTDCYYFWLNNFRTNLKKIVVESDKSNITIDSFNQII